MTTIATWNVNSVKARLGNVLEWVDAALPDVLLLQEIKCEAEAFPRLEFETRGYACLAVGQKSYNGVALLARAPIEDPVTALPGDAEDGQARYVEATVGGIRVASIYLPNGNPVESDKFPYKLAWMDRLRAHVGGRRFDDMPLVLGGDYNVIPEAIDCYDPAAWEGDALFRPESRAKFRALENLGLTDAFRALHAGKGHYTFWDYQRGAWQHDHGIRIDHFLINGRAADRLRECEIDRGPRAREKASDHTPVVLTLED
mgnify:CR=1 FL=1